MAHSGAPHPLDDCDPDACYQTMMSERTSLITARRESEDNLIKTVIQLAAALLALLAGFISQAQIAVSQCALVLFGTALASLMISIVAGLCEQRFSSNAYLQQQKLVEDYFQKKISDFAEPAANDAVRKAQATAFITFVAALLCLGLFAFVEARQGYVKGQGSAAVETSASAPTGHTSVETGKPNREVQRCNQVGGPVNAAAAAVEQEMKPQ
jgi:hypothetical protein